MEKVNAVKVFIGGSKSIGRLPQSFISKLNEFMKNGCEFLIGDCHGVDLAVQNYLYTCNERNVTVYCSGIKPRHNLGNWKVIAINETTASGYEFYRQKDIRMAQNSDCGLMVWNGTSKGTKHNIEYLQSLNKRVEVIMV